MDYVITLDDWLKYVATLPVIERKEVLNINLPKTKKGVYEITEDAKADRLNHMTGENYTPLEWSQYKDIILLDGATGIEIFLYRR